MFVNNIKIRNFRNHSFFNHQLQRQTYIYGDNGSGKTSILESIYLALNLRTFKKQTLKNIVQFGEQSFHVTVSINHEPQHEPQHHGNSSADNHITLFYQDEMILKNNGEKVDSSMEHLHNNPVIYYSPNTDSLLSSDQSTKRKQLDKIVFHTYMNYANELNTYNRLLNQKRHLLHGIQNNDGHLSHNSQTLLKVLNDQLIPITKTIHHRRKKIVEQINRNLTNIYETLQITEPNLHTQIYLSYSSNVDPNHNTEATTNLLEREKIEGTPLYGTHRDRINIRKDGKIFEKFPSFGQGKAFHITLLKSISQIISHERGITPLILLDDFEAGLDNRRIKSLLSMFDSSHNAQVIATGVNPSANLSHMHNIHIAATPMDSNHEHATPSPTPSPTPTPITTGKPLNTNDANRKDNHEYN